MIQNMHQKAMERNVSLYARDTILISPDGVERAVKGVWNDISFYSELRGMNTSDIAGEKATVFLMYKLLHSAGITSPQLIGIGWKVKGAPNDYIQSSEYMIAETPYFDNNLCCMVIFLSNYVEGNVEGGLE